MQGRVIDFILDLRPDSKTYGKMIYVLLEPGMLFFVPRGMAHGFISLEHNTIFSYKCDNFYNKESEAGYSIFDKKLNIIPNLENYIKNNIDKAFDETCLTLSIKDMKHPCFSEKCDNVIK